MLTGPLPASGIPPLLPIGKFRPTSWWAFFQHGVISLSVQNTRLGVPGKP
ncbi:hypothetical protein C8C94_5092 [Acidovorax sp. 94]|jgi:hypothetical protein|nr:hypothetical protein C8C94_5092 [Acidovorax sp. 94]